MRKLPPFVPSPRRGDVLDAVGIIRAHQAAGRPLSLIRLGDGEGALAGFPDLAGRAALDRSLGIWFGRTDFSGAALVALGEELREAIRAADVIGLPRVRQQGSPLYQRLVYTLRMFELVGGNQLLVDAAVHRYLQFGLFYRSLLAGQPFCGLVTCRDLGDRIGEVFGIGEVGPYPVPEEAAHCES